MTAMTITIHTAQPRGEILKHLTSAIQSSAGWVAGQINNSDKATTLHAVLCRGHLNAFLDRLICERLVNGHNAVVQMLRLLQQDGNATEVNVTCAIHFQHVSADPDVLASNAPQEVHPT